MLSKWAFIPVTINKLKKKRLTIQNLIQIRESFNFCPHLHFLLVGGRISKNPEITIYIFVFEILLIKNQVDILTVLNR